MIRCFTALTLAAVALAARADKTPRPLAPLKAPASKDAPLPDVKDDSFDKHFDADALARAWVGRDAEALADLALKLAAREQAVGRAHKKGGGR